MSLSTALFSTPYPLEGPVSGYYLVKLTTPPPQQGPPTAESYIIFVLRDDNRDAGFLMNSAVTTYQAYNGWGGNSLYNSLPDGGPQPLVSFDRPYGDNHGMGDFMDTNLGIYLQNPNDLNFRWPGGYEYPMVRFLEREGYDVTYATDIDLHSKANLLNNRKAFLSVGHDEYWSKEMHDNLENARDRSTQPTNIAFFSGNSVYWIINLLPSSTDAGYRIIETHKSPFPNQTSPSWRWQDCPRVWSGFPSQVQTCSADEGSEQKLVGSITTSLGTDRGDIVFAAKDFGSDAGWILRDTGLSTTSRLAGMIGYESQRVKPEYPQPLNQTVFAQSQFKSRPQKWATPEWPEYQRADMSLYQPDSGSLVVSLGSPDWSMGLDIYDDTFFPSSIYLRDHPAVPQMTRNILEGVGGLPHVPPQQTIGPGYAVTLIPAATCFNANQLFTAHVTAPLGRSRQQCINSPWCDAVSVYNVSQNDDDDPASKTYIERRMNISVNAPSAPGTYTVDYVTVDRTWRTDYDHPVPDGGTEYDQLRTIWRAAKSPRFCVPCPCVPNQ